MTNNEAVRCPKCGRKRAENENHYLMNAGICGQHLDFSLATDREMASDDCASHAKAKAVPGEVDTLIADLESIAERHDLDESECGVIDNVVALLKARAESSKAVPAEGQAARDVLAERQRQIEKEGFNTAHDDEHDTGELSAAAASYAQNVAIQLHWKTRGKPLDHEIPVTWPWDAKWWKPTSPRRDLVKAAALILAEIERIDRAALSADSGRDGCQS